MRIKKLMLMIMIYKAHLVSFYSPSSRFTIMYYHRMEMKVMWIKKRKYNLDSYD